MAFLFKNNNFVRADSVKEVDGKMKNFSDDEIREG